jgi:hypothetical protein
LAALLTFRSKVVSIYRIAKRREMLRRRRVGNTSHWHVVHKLKSQNDTVKA